MAEGIKEIHLEDHIINYLTREVNPNNFEYTIKDRSCYDKDLCLIPEDVMGFLEDTQPEKIEKLNLQHGHDTYKNIVYRVSEQLKRKKTLDVFREKVKDRGQNLDLAYFKPNHNKSPEHNEWYKKNRLTIIR